MRFNCHTHIFPLKTVFTLKTLQIFLNRIGRDEWPPFVIEVIDELARQAIAGVPLDEDDIVRAFAAKLGDSKKFASFLKGIDGKIPGDVQLLIDGDPALVGTNALRDRLRRLGDLITENKDAENKTLNDLLATLVIALKPSVAAVADKLMELSGPDTTVVALMMDITSGGSADEELFQQQIEDTAAAALAYPGRLLPFVAVHEQRESHFERMQYALTERGFAGIKLYPSLGTNVGSDAMARVFDYCAEHDVPILLHCSAGGFYATKAQVKLCDPARWNKILEQRPQLRVCFGHFGGDENLVGRKIPADSWTQTILELMASYPGVYADIAFHDRPMAGGAAQENYFAQLESLLSAGSTAAGRILFGSDFFLVRQRVREDNLWDYFKTNFSAAAFEQITVTNPSAFLGLPKADGSGTRPNIARHLQWLAAHRADVRGAPSEWAQAGITNLLGAGVAFNPGGLGPRWTLNNTAHHYTWYYLKERQLYPTEAALPFPAAGAVRVRQLQYWNKEHEAPEIFATKCAAVARGLHQYLAKFGAYEESVDAISAVRVLEKLFADGERQLFQLGAAADELFRFEKEIHA
jgi:predicted TIM-barrel fold metal-dependent hydrolase